jgi:hypothetical protein
MTARQRRDVGSGGDQWGPPLTLPSEENEPVDWNRDAAHWKSPGIDTR